MQFTAQSREYSLVSFASPKVLCTPSESCHSADAECLSQFPHTCGGPSRGWVSGRAQPLAAVCRESWTMVPRALHTSSFNASLWLALSNAVTSASNKAQGTLGDCRWVPTGALRAPRFLQAQSTYHCRSFG